MSKQKILLTETHHGGILVAFYKTLMETCGRQQGFDTFMTAARAYGERRGRRMAMRAVRDGNPLDMTSMSARRIAGGHGNSKPWGAWSAAWTTVQRSTVPLSGGSIPLWALPAPKICISTVPATFTTTVRRWPRALWRHMEIGLGVVKW